MLTILQNFSYHLPGGCTKGGDISKGASRGEFLKVAAIQWRKAATQWRKVLPVLTIMLASAQHTICSSPIRRIQSQERTNKGVSDALEIIPPIGSWFTRCSFKILQQLSYQTSQNRFQIGSDNLSSEISSQINSQASFQIRSHVIFCNQIFVRGHSMQLLPPPPLPPLGVIYFAFCKAILNKTDILKSSTFFINSKNLNSLCLFLAHERSCDVFFFNFLYVNVCDVSIQKYKLIIKLQDEFV